MSPETTVWKRKGSEDGQNNLIPVLLALIDRAGGAVSISLEELDAINGRGIRARYDVDGGISAWTYDVAEDLQQIKDTNT